LAERSRGYLTGLVAPGTANEPGARAPHRIAWRPGPIDPGGRRRRIGPLPPPPPQPPDPPAPPPGASGGPAPRRPRRQGTSRPQAPATLNPASQEPPARTAPRPVPAGREPALRRNADQRRVRVDRSETGQDRVQTTNPVRTSPAPATSPVRTSPAPAISTPGPTRAVAADAMARLAALSGPSLEAQPAAWPRPRAPATRPDRSGAVGAVQVSPPAAAPPTAVSRRARRAEVPAVQIGSIEVTVTRPAPPPPPAPPRPAPATPARTRGAAHAASGGRLSRPAPLYGLAQG